MPCVMCLFCSCSLAAPKDWSELRKMRGEVKFEVEALSLANDSIEFVERIIPSRFAARGCDLVCCWSMGLLRGLR